jgi:hypothetical protein
MAGPSPRDFAAAVAAPAGAFADPALAAADPVLGADGLPAPHPGGRAVVFQVCAAAGAPSWAVKCYPDAPPGLAGRYAAVADAVRRGRFPGAVPARFLPEGVRVGGAWHPAVVLDWVEGTPLRRAVRDRAADPRALDALLRAWLRLAAALRAAGVAHGDLAADNVLVVPGADPVRLVDYDAAHLPGLPPADEAGHPNFAHPAGADPADRDRFPLLVVATALKAVAALGRPAWDRYDTGDNLLFTATDFRTPDESPLFRALLDAADPELRALAGALARACRRPAAQTPWADELARPPAPAARPARPAADPPPRPLWRQLAVPLAVLAGLCMVGAGGVAGLVSAVLDPPDAAEVEVAEAPPPKAPPAPVPAPPRVAPPPPAPPAVPEPAPEPEFPAGPAEYRQVWVKPFEGTPFTPAVFFTQDGKTLLAQARGAVHQFDATTGADLPPLRGTGTPVAQLQVWSPRPDRLVLYGSSAPAPTTWDRRTGERLPDPPAAGPLHPGGAAGRVRCELSPDGRFLFAGGMGVPFGDAHAAAPFRVTEVATGRAVRAADWTYGNARFTADGSRVLVGETAGRFRWLRLPGGATEAEWAYRPWAGPDPVHSLSDDGALGLFQVRPPSGLVGTYLADARTGQLLRLLPGGEVAASRGGLTGDGRWVVLVGPDPDDRGAVTARLSDARTGAVLVRTPLDLRPHEALGVAVARDGRALAWYDGRRRELSCYALRGAVPPVPPGTRVPPPVAAAPPPRAPDGPLAADPAPANPFRDRLAPPFPAPVNPFPVPANPFPPAIRPVPNAPLRPPVFEMARPPLPNVPVPPAGRPADPDPPPARRALPAAPALAPRWTAPVARDEAPRLPDFTPDGKTVLVSDGAGGAALTFDARTGVPGPGRPPVPPPAGEAEGAARVVSPSGRYQLAARTGPGAAGFRVVDATTGKAVAAGPWAAGEAAGRVAFAADEAGVLVLTGEGKAAWYKLPSGEKAAEWAAEEGAAARAARVLAASAGGRRAIYYGTRPGSDSLTTLIDGTTGAAVRPLFAFPHQLEQGAALSPDGRTAAASVRDPATRTWHVDVIAVDGWRVLGRVSRPAGTQPEPARFRFSPDGRSLVVSFPGVWAGQLGVYPVPAVPAE